MIFFSLGLHHITNHLLTTRRRNRQILLISLDLFVFIFSVIFATLLRFDHWDKSIKFLMASPWFLIVVVASQLLLFYASGVYRPILRFSTATHVRSIGQAIGISLLTTLIFHNFLTGWKLSNSILLINAILVFISTIGLRLVIFKYLHFYSQRQRQSAPISSPQRLLIYGAGQAGAELLQALKFNLNYQVNGFIDDNPDLNRYANLDGYPVYPYSKAEKLWAVNGFDLVVLALPSVEPTVRRRIVKRLQEASIPVKTVPSLGDILSGQVKINQIRDLDIVDLLGREEASPDLMLLQKQTFGKVVLVTGAGGSIGSELCRQIVLQRPRSLILYELNEFALYQIHQELSESHPDIAYIPCLGNVTDETYLSSVLRTYQVEVFYHAAAYKHVPLLESNIAKGVENNVKGTLSAARSALANGVDHFVLISTDKAVRPTNIMGTTKRVAELIIQALAADPQTRTCFAIVRFGNVLGSSGSVVPRFQSQIAKGGPITLTHSEITRYFMSIPEAARLVIQAGALAQGGEVFLLDMGEPVKIYDLATQMIRLSGLVPGDDIAIEITGLRPGEKLYEELLISGDNVQRTCHAQIYSSHEYFIPWSSLEPLLFQLFRSISQNDTANTRALLKRLVPEYTPKPSSAHGPSQTLQLVTPPQVSSSKNSRHLSSGELVWDGI